MLIKKFHLVGGRERSRDFLKSIYQHFFQVETFLSTFIQEFIFQFPMLIKNSPIFQQKKAFYTLYTHQGLDSFF